MSTGTLISPPVQAGAEHGGTAAQTARGRLESIDAVRGLIMIVMALDHTREFFSIPGQNPTNLATTTIPLFFTRWITHFCAPVFFLLMGTGAYLAGRSRSRGELSWFLLSRGLWLVLLELVLGQCVILQFGIEYRVIMLVVLWALGWALVVLSLLVFLPNGLIALLGAVMIAGHNLLDSVRLATPLWSILHAPGVVVNTPRHVVFVLYPLIPWLGVTAIGYSLGQLYGLSSARRRRLLLGLGLALTAGFLAVRWLNRYGDPAPWAPQRTEALTALSFLNTTKYPPSLEFLLMTLGPALLLLWILDHVTPRWLRPAVTIGKVPLFYFVVHFPLIHLLAVAVCYVRYGSAHWMFDAPDLAHYPFTPPPEWGFSLPGVYAMWVLVVALMYPLCRWYAAVKARRAAWWLSYL